MKRTHTTIAASLAAVLFGSLMMNSASAATRSSNWSDLASVTNAGAHKSGVPQIGHSSKEFSVDDLSAVTHRSVPVGVKPMVKATGKNYGRNDITAVTHHYH